MESRSYGYAVGIAGFLYGTVGYGLSIFTYIVGATLRCFFIDATAHPASLAPTLRRGRPSSPADTKLKPRRVRDPFRNATSKPSLKSPDPNPTANANEKMSLQPLPDARLRRVSSLDSFHDSQSFVLVAPIITINHSDEADNSRRNIPTITIHPNSLTTTDRNNPKLRRLTLHQSPLPTTGPNRPGSTFRLSGLKPLWGGEKPKIHRSASSPQLTEFTEEKLSSPPQSKKDCKDTVKLQSTLSRKSSRKTLRQEKSDTAISQAPSKFFSSFPKSVEKKRSQALRTQPYDAPYFVPPPVPPIPHNVVRTKVAKRSKTMPTEK